MTALRQKLYTVQGHFQEARSANEKREKEVAALRDEMQTVRDDKSEYQKQCQEWISTTVEK